MKKNLLIALMLIASTTFATVHTVNNTGGAQFSNINSAVTAASPGDTIYIHGSSTAYSSPTTVKTGITFIGAGLNLTKQNPFITNVPGKFEVGANNKLIGIYTGAVGNSAYGGTVYNGLTLQRCYLYGDYNNVIFGSNNSISSITNMIIEDCFISSATTNAVFWCYLNDRPINNLIIRNNIIYSNGTSYLFDAMDPSSNGILIDHNIFISSGATQSIFKPGCTGTPGITFTNNIFQNTNVLYGTFMFFNNFSTTENLNISGSGNIQGASPQLVNYPGGGFNFATHDYHLTFGSPCIGTGTGGTDMGIYSGVAPFIWEGHPPIPQMDYFNIIGTQAPQGGSINVTFQSTIKN